MSDKSTVVTVSNLKTLLVPTKTADVHFPGFSGFVVKLSFLSRETLVNMRKKATKTTFKGRQAGEELDDEMFLELYVRAAVKGWSGLKLSYLEKLAPVDMTGQDPDAELAYSEENALFLMKSSASFDAWVSEQVTDLTNFQSSNTN